MPLPVPTVIAIGGNTVEKWPVEAVSQWLTSLDEPYNEYSKAFLGEYNS